VRVILWIGIGTVISLTMAAFSTYRFFRAGEPDNRRTHVVLVGASIGAGWHLSEWARRTGVSQFSAESVAAWQFDKADAVEDIVRRPRVHFRFGRSYLASFLHPPRRPQIVILKECSAYFPGDLAQYRSLMGAWLQRLSDSGFQVVPATVAPITRSRAARDPGKQESLMAYNQWVRKCAAERHLLLLDLEAALRGADTYLRDDFAAEDGSHLNAHAYAALDAELVRLLSASSSQPAGSAEVPSCLF
jgi:hypothetical protein